MDTKEDYFFTHINAKTKGQNPFILFVGKNIKIHEIEIFGLKPGDKVSQIGHDRGRGPGSGMAALNRCCNFKPYIIYAGIREEPEMKSRLLMFRVRDVDKPNEIKPDDDYFLAYQILNEDTVPELKVFDFRYNVPLIYRPKFIHYDDRTDTN